MEELRHIVSKWESPSILMLLANGPALENFCLIRMNSTGTKSGGEKVTGVQLGEK